MVSNTGLQVSWVIRLTQSMLSQEGIGASREDRRGWCVSLSFGVALVARCVTEHIGTASSRFTANGCSGIAKHICRRSE